MPTEHAGNCGRGNLIIPEAVREKSDLGYKIVLINNGAYPELVFRPVLNAHNSSFTAHADALGQSNLRRKRKCEFDV